MTALSTRKKAGFAIVVAASSVAAIELGGGFDALREATRAERERTRRTRILSGEEQPPAMIQVPADAGPTLVEELAEDFVLRDTRMPWRLSRADGGCSWLLAEYPDLTEADLASLPESLESCMAEHYRDDASGLHVSKGAITQRRHELSFTKPEGEVWIAAAGASSVELYVEINLSWARSLERLLDEALAAVGEADRRGITTFRVHNFGMGGTGAELLRWRVEHEISRRPYDFAILYTGINDSIVGEYFRPETFERIERFYWNGEEAPLVASHPWFGAHIDTWRRWRQELLERAPPGATGYPFDSFHYEALAEERRGRVEASLERLREGAPFDFARFDQSELRSLPMDLVSGWHAYRDLRGAIDALGAAGITAIVSAPPTNVECLGPWPDGDRIPLPVVNTRLPLRYEETAAFLTGPFRTALEELARQEGLPYVDVHGLLGELDCINNSLDTVHVSHVGIEVLATRYAAEILDALAIPHDLDARRVARRHNRTSALQGRSFWTTRPGFARDERPIKHVDAEGRITVTRRRVAPATAPPSTDG